METTTSTSTAQLPLYVVIGATGQQGLHTLRHLLGKDVHARVRALTRDSKGRSAQRIRDMAVSIQGTGATGLNRLEIVEGDVRDLDRLREVLRGAAGVLVILEPGALGDGDHAKGCQAEEQVGKKIVDLAQELGVPQIVYSSMGGADRPLEVISAVGFLASKHRIEQHLKAKAAGFKCWTIIRPTWFFENFINWPDYYAETMRAGVFWQPLPADRRLQGIALDDLGKFYAMALLQPDRFNGVEIEVAADEPTQLEYARALDLRFEERPLQSLALKDHIAAFDFHRRVGFRADIKRCREMMPGMRTFADWVREYRSEMPLPPAAQ